MRDNISVISPGACCGCQACVSACPLSCISVQKDAEGFLIPEVDASRCSNCGRCLNVCLQRIGSVHPGPIKTYAVRNRDEEKLMKSSSGGMFIALAEHVLSKGGAVFGCAFDENLRARHVCVRSVGGLRALQGSKYVQSDVCGTYLEAKDLLEQGVQVLYTGTPCQIAGLKAVLAKEYENLVTADLVCHGTPSPALFERYIQSIEKRLGGGLTGYAFRDKTQNGWGLDIRMDTLNKTKHTNSSLDPYMNVFLKNASLRESCYACTYASGKRAGDITMGDYWGVKNEHPEFYDKRGVSVVLINSAKGTEVFNAMSERIWYLESTFDQAAKGNAMLKNPAVRPEARSELYKGIDEKRYIQKKLRAGLQVALHLKTMLPPGLKLRIKALLGKR